MKTAIRGQKKTGPDAPPTSPRSRRVLLALVTAAAIILLAAAAVTSARRDALPPPPQPPAISWPDLPGSPSETKRAVYTEVAAYLAAKENPATRPIPKALLSTRRDEAEFQRWTLRTMKEGVAYQQKVFDAVGRKRGMTKQQVADTHAKVYDWRLRNDLPLD